MSSYDVLKALMDSEEESKKLRRRQSDARWRANLASCFESLKSIIPLNMKASRKQMSKAAILTETSNHINFLESMLMKALEEKGQLEGQMDLSSWCASQRHSIMDGFERSQRRDQSRRRQPNNNAHGILEDTVKPHECCDELLETIICTENGVEWSEVVSSSANVYESNSAQNKNDQILQVFHANSDFTPVKFPQGCYHLHASMKSSPLPSASQDSFIIIDPVCETDFRGSDLDISSNVSSYSDDNNRNVRSLMCDEMMWQSDDDSSSLCDNRFESTPRRNRQKHRSNQGTLHTPVRKFRSVKTEPSVIDTSDNGRKRKVSSCAFKHRRNVPKCRRSLNLGLTDVGQQEYKAAWRRPVKELTFTDNSQPVDCDVAKEYVILSHDLDVSFAEELSISDLVPSCSTPLSSQIGSSYDEDYNDALSTARSPGTPFKYFVNEAAADVPLAPRLLLPTNGARSFSAVDDCYNRETESDVLTSFEYEKMNEDEWDGFVGQFSPLFSGVLLTP